MFLHNITFKCFNFIYKFVNTKIKNIFKDTYAHTTSVDMEQSFSAYKHINNVLIL